MLLPTTPRRPALGLAVFALALSGVASADPITFVAQPQPDPGSVMVMERGAWASATEGPGPEQADDQTFILTTAVLASLHRRVNVGASVDTVWRHAELSSPTGGRIERQAAGLGDVTVMISSALAWEFFGGQVGVSPFASVKFPTGTDDASDSFGRLPQRLQVGTGALDVAAGMLFSWSGDILELHSATTYVASTKANDFDAGDVLRWEFAAQRCILPVRRCSQRKAIRLHGSMETRVVWQDADEGLLAPEISGGTNWFAAPGLRLLAGRHAMEAAVELPVRQPADQHVDFIARVGYRILVD